MRKPYTAAGAKKHKFEEEVSSLSPAMQSFILTYGSDITDRDTLHDWFVCCYESVAEKGRFSKALALQKVQTMTQKKKRDQNTLYNPYRNISLNQCIGDSKTPVSEWLNVTGWREWE